MSARSKRPTFEDPELQRGIMELRAVDNHTNLGYVALEYATLALILTLAIGFAESRAAWGLAWAWNVPVFTLAIIFIGGVQHRLAGLGHESSHYSFMKNRFLNDLVPDLLCMFPIFTTIHFYRLFHMAHHQFTNDPERDSDILNLGQSKRFDEFPMSRQRFIAVVYFCMITAPIRFLKYQFAYINVNVLGRGRNVYIDKADRSGAATARIRIGTILGFGYVLAYNAATFALVMMDHADWIIPLGVLGLVVVAIAAYTIPESWLFRSPFRQSYSARFASVVRIGYYTVALMILSRLRIETAGRSSLYFMLLWVVPMGTSFMFYMFLRDVYQHSNADAGRLTNSRVFYTDWFTRWSVFVYGQDMHIPHHLFPAVPHYRLGALHGLLKERHEGYREHVVECHGTFHGDADRPAILDVLTTPNLEASAAAASIGLQSIPPRAKV